MIRVSDIRIYLRCPRISYFSSRGNDLVNEVTPEYLYSIILKELALTYATACSQEDRLIFLNEELDRLSTRIHVIYRTELSGIETETCLNSISDVRMNLENICSNLSKNGKFYNYESIQNEPLLRSEKFGLTGSPDRLILMGDDIIPSIIKTGNMPENGVWKSDRLQLTAYAILVEEIYDKIIERGFIEYAGSGKVREVKLKRQDRRKVLQIVEKIKKIQNGTIPEKPENAPCSNCGFNNKCDVKTTLASRFF